MFACSLKICGVLGGCCLFGEGKWGQSGIQLKAMALLTVTCISRSIFLSLSSHLPPPPPVVLTAKMFMILYAWPWPFKTGGLSES